MSDDKRIVPWIDHAEFISVASLISDYESDKLRSSYQTIQVWLTRLPKSNIPRSILCTYELLSAYFEQSTQSLALALMRFVSLLSSESQDRERPYLAIPLISLARKVGIPCWLTDLRNDVAHGTIPSLVVLENGFVWAINYLKRFWLVNIDYVRSQRHELDSHFSSQCELFSALIERLFSKKCLDKSSNSELSSLRELLAPKYYLFVVNLLSSKLCSQSLSYLDSTSFSINYIISNQICDYSLLHKWLFKNQIVHFYITQFILSLKFQNTLEMEVRLLWCIEWLRAINCWKLDEKHSLSCFINENVVHSLNWRKCLSHLLSNLCTEFEDLILYVVSLCHPPLENDKRDKILDVINVFFGRGTISVVACNTTIALNPWKLSHGYIWNEMPLGVTISLWFTPFYIYFFLAQNAETSRQYQRFLEEDPKSRC